MGDDDTMLVGEAQNIGLKTIHATCVRCYRPHQIALGKMPNALRLCDVPQEAGLRCTFCSGLRFTVCANWRDFTGPPMTECVAPFTPKAPQPRKTIARRRKVEA